MGTRRIVSETWWRQTLPTVTSARLKQGRHTAMSAENSATLAKPELGARLARVRAEMKKEGLEALFVGQSTDLEYLLGVDRRIHYYGATHFFGEWAVGAVIRSEGDPLLLVPRHMAEFHFDVSADPP